MKNVVIKEEYKGWERLLSLLLRLLQGKDFGKLIVQIGEDTSSALLKILWILNTFSCNLYFMQLIQFQNSYQQDLKYAHVILLGIE